MGGVDSGASALSEGAYVVGVVIDWVVMVAGAVGSIYVLTNARRLADRPRRSTEWRPPRRVWLVVAAMLLLAAIGALLNLTGA